VAGQFVVSEPRTASLKGLSRPVDVVTIEWRGNAQSTVSGSA